MYAQCGLQPSLLCANRKPVLMRALQWLPYAGRKPCHKAQGKINMNDSMQGVCSISEA
jgi:hypothetical protein